MQNGNPVKHNYFYRLARPNVIPTLNWMVK